MEERLKSVNYKIRQDIPESGVEYCSACAYGFEGIGNIDDRVCSKHNVYVGAFDICDCFEDWAEVTEEGRKFKAHIQKFAEINSKEIKKESSQSSEGCYIATAVYGGYDQPQVLVLRKFRDEVLKKNFFGRIFISIYYTLSPKVAEKLKNHKRINGKVKDILDKFVAQLENDN